MKHEIGFIGDIHGFPPALKGAFRKLNELGIPEVILLGDYVNKGPDSRGVIEFLSSWNDPELHIVPLRGNHDHEFLKSLESGDVRPLLKLSGAPTIRSYVEGDVGPDVFQELSQAVPESHRQFLRSLPRTFHRDGIVGTHDPQSFVGEEFHVSAHRYVGDKPEIGLHFAGIDTGCGIGGLLTVFLWPSREFFQFTEDGQPISL